MESAGSHSTETVPGPPSPTPKPPRSQSAVPRNAKPAVVKGGTGIHAYVAEAARSMKRAATFSRAPSRAGSPRASSARPTVGRSDSGGSSQKAGRPASGRPPSGRASPLLTPDASVKLVSQDGSREGAASHHNGAASGISTISTFGCLVRGCSDPCMYMELTICFQPKWSDEGITVWILQRRQYAGGVKVSSST